MPLEELEQQLRALQTSRILLSALELDVFAALASPATASELAERLATEPRATALLLNALVALGYLGKSEGTFRIAEAEEYLGDRACRTALLHHAHRWNSWSQLTARVRGTVPAEDYRSLPAEVHESYLAMQNIRAKRRAATVAGALDADSLRRVLDLGGGSAAFAIELARLNPKLEADVVELPKLLPITQRHIAEAQLSDRLRAIPGDLHAFEPGSGYDLVLLCSVAHLFGEAENRSLFARCHRALHPGGRLAIHDHVMAEDKTMPAQGALFAVNMLVATPNGATYSFEEYAEWLRSAGFRTIEQQDIGTPIGLLVATA